MPDRFDVLAVNIKSGTIRLLGERMSEDDAEATIKIAVMRRGVTEDYYTTAPAGDYKDGDFLRRDEQ